MKPHLIDQRTPLSLKAPSAPEIWASSLRSSIFEHQVFGGVHTLTENLSQLQNKGDRLGRKWGGGGWVGGWWGSQGVL